MANNHVNKTKNEQDILEQGFRAGVAYACWSMGKFEKDEETDNLKKFSDALWSDFVRVLKRRKDGKTSDSK